MKKLISRLLLYFNYHYISKERKKLIYYDCLNQLNKYPVYICTFIETYFKKESLIFGIENKYILGDRFMFVFFPELFIQKPKKLKKYRKGGWFDIYHRTPRVDVLRKAIKLLT